MFDPKDQNYLFTYIAGKEYNKDYRQSEASIKSEYLTVLQEPG